METTQNLSNLDSFQRAAYLAHYWTSFSPDKRADQLIKDYSEQLEEDITELKAANISDETINQYVERYKRLFSGWLSAKSRCASPMITGPAKFNNRRAEKANRSEENHYKLWQEWRIRAKRAITRKTKEEKTFLSEIDRYKNELAKLKGSHEKAKEGNKLIAKARKENRDISAILIQDYDIAPHMVDWCMKFGFHLANITANIRRVEDRIKLMEQKNERANTIGQKEMNFEGVTVIFNHEADRIQIKHDCKPPQETIYKLKSNGFKWSPSFGAWQRQLNSNGIWAAERVLNVKLRGQAKP